MTDRIPITDISELDGECKMLGRRYKFAPGALAEHGFEGTPDGPTLWFPMADIEALIAAGLITKPAPPITFEGTVAGHLGFLALSIPAESGIRPGDKVLVTKIGNKDR